VSNFASVQFWTIDNDHAGQRIDNYLFTRLKGVPKSRIYRILRKGEVRVNKGRVKAEYKLLPDDIVRIPPSHRGLLFMGGAVCLLVLSKLLEL